MEKLKQLVQEHSRWSELMVYINRIETFRDTDCSSSIENAKALLETIAKEICAYKERPMNDDSNMSGLLKGSFIALGLTTNNAGRRISTALGTIGQEFGTIRNTIGITAHGKTIEEIKTRNDFLDKMTQDFLLNTVVSVACFLINLFEAVEFGKRETIEIFNYSSYESFNEYWDSIFTSFEMGNYSFLASEVLFYTDLEAYKAELKMFDTSEENINEE